VPRPALWPAVLTAVLVLAVPAAAGAQPIHATVVGGSDATIDGWPFIAALVVHGQSAEQGQFCGASVADSTHVITAAHCVEGEKASGIDVVVGRARLGNAGGERVRVAGLAVEPQYDNEDNAHDIAILTLATAVSAPAIVPAGPDDAELDNAGSTVAVAGWGLVSQSPPTNPSVLQQAFLTVVGPSRCRKAYGSGFDTTLTICAGTPDTGVPDSCLGDSGGPLAASGPSGLRLVGLVSFGSDICGDPDAPGAYTRVRSESSFIAQHLSGALPVEPGPEPAEGRLDPVVRIGRIWCKSRCYVDVGATGPGAAEVPGLVVRVRRGASSRHSAFDRSYSARRLSATRWRAKVGLPFGRLRISARAIDDEQRQIGTSDRVLVDVE
jgi:trypsin